MSYYVVKVYGLDCDSPGCNESEEAVPAIDARRKLADTRRQLALPPSGWTHRDGRDYCPKCSAKDVTPQ